MKNAPKTTEFREVKELYPELWSRAVAPANVFGGNSVVHGTNDNSVKRLLFLGIANALDLTDRVLPRMHLRPECR